MKRIIGYIMLFVCYVAMFWGIPYMGSIDTSPTPFWVTWSGFHGMALFSAMCYYGIKWARF